MRCVSDNVTLTHPTNNNVFCTRLFSMASVWETPMLQAATTEMPHRITQSVYRPPGNIIHSNDIMLCHG